MNAPGAKPIRLSLPLPAFVLHPVTALFIACVHVYLASGHLVALATGDVGWTHIWKGFGALAGAYVFAALALRGLARHEDRRHRKDADWSRQREQQLEPDFRLR
jgi:hypothetical protein